MPLRKRFKSVPASASASAQPAKGDDGKRSKRQRLADFFRARKSSSGISHLMGPPRSAVPAKPPAKPPRDSKLAESTRPRASSSSVDVQVQPKQPQQLQQPAGGLPTPPPEPAPTLDAPPQQAEPIKPDYLAEEHVRALFSGAPHFFVQHTDTRPIPRVSYPWDHQLAVKDVSDSLQLAEPAFSAATLHRHLPALQKASDQDTPHRGYAVDVVELPSMLSAQGIEPGSIGFAHFIELSQPDHLVTDLQQSHSSNDYLDALRNKELMQQNPERLGIRSVDMTMVHDRLVELADLIEAFHHSPEPMTILNNQPPGDLYANLFGKFLTPPGYDSTVHDPTGIKVQIDTLLKILRLRGVWFDFSLVEWRIRLGQILWNEPEPEDELHAQPLWADRDILLLQITLACELLLRLDAITSMDLDDVQAQMHVSPQDVQGFLHLKTRKTDWDLVLARRFLENVLPVKEIDVAPLVPESKSRGLFSLLTPSTPKDGLTTDLVLLPQHQARQLAGLLHFSQKVKWPGIELIIAELAQKIIPEAAPTPDQMSTPTGRVLDPSTPASISVYATPLATPRSNTMLDSYFGNLQRPSLGRGDSRSLQMSLSTTSLAHADSPNRAIAVGGWLSRSYLTGLILPGEAISHFLMSTLLENDKLAIAALGDSANLYGGFIYAERTWWSKASIVARVLACIEGASECMGWVTFPTLPVDSTDGWYAVKVTQVRPEQPSRLTSEDEVIARDSAAIPDLDESAVKAEDLVLPRDAPNPPIPAVEFLNWSLTSVDGGLSDNDSASAPIGEADTYAASVTFTSLGRITHNLALLYDVQFITSWPCTPPAASPAPAAPRLLKRSQTTPLSRTSSKRSFHSSRTASNRSSQLIRRNSHGFEPLLSHPPDSPSIAPTRMYLPVPDEDLNSHLSPGQEPLNAHPLHMSYKFKILPATDILDPTFALPFTLRIPSSPAPTPQDEKDTNEEPDPIKDDQIVLVLDARASQDLELLARSWCAERGFHAIVGRTGRTCLACCIREARGLGLNIVIRV